MTVEHYNELINLLHEKILRLECDKSMQRKEIKRLKRELSRLKPERSPNSETVEKQWRKQKNLPLQAF